MRILIEAKELRFMIGDTLLTPEPFFCTLTLYDVAKHRKVSEDFHFDFGLSTDTKCERADLILQLLFMLICNR